MKKLDYFLAGGGIGMFLMFIIMIICIITFSKSFHNEGQIEGYKQGQIDALNGIQNWDKVIKSDTIYIKIN